MLAKTHKGPRLSPQYSHNAVNSLPLLRISQALSGIVALPFASVTTKKNSAKKFFRDSEPLSYTAHLDPHWFLKWFLNRVPKKSPLHQKKSTVVDPPDLEPQCVLGPIHTWMKEI